MIKCQSGLPRGATAALQGAEYPNRRARGISPPSSARAGGGSAPRRGSRGQGSVAGRRRGDQGVAGPGGNPLKIFSRQAQGKLSNHLDGQVVVPARSTSRTSPVTKGDPQQPSPAAGVGAARAACPGLPPVGCCASPRTDFAAPTDPTLASDRHSAANTQPAGTRGHVLL